MISKVAKLITAEEIFESIPIGLGYCQNSHRHSFGSCYVDNHSVLNFLIDVEDYSLLRLIFS